MPEPGAQGVQGGDRLVLPVHDHLSVQHAQGLVLAHEGVVSGLISVGPGLLEVLPQLTLARQPGPGPLGKRR